jgi:MoaA/NifB/PqqE/SkfB family radical SAM enzyme
MKLEDIGFLEVIDDRAKSIAAGKISYCEWIITSHCNFKCPYCNPIKEPDLSLEQAKQVVKTLAGMHCKYVHITGGEPTTRKDLLDIIKEIKSYGMRIGISTNGSRNTEYYIELVNAGVELYSISLDVHEKNLNKKFTMVADNVFDVVANNIKELSKLVYTNVGIVINDDNANLYKEIIGFVSNLGAHDIRLMTSTKYNKLLKLDVPQELLDKHPILKFRVENFNSGKNMRGSELGASHKCHLVRDDITIMGKYYFPCAVYAREGGKPIGEFDRDNESGRMEWFKIHDSYLDTICKQYCMDFKCRFNEKVDNAKL